MHPAALMLHLRIDGLKRGGQARATVSDDQQQVLAAQAAPIQIVQKAFPGRRTRKLTPSKNRYAHSSFKGACWNAFTKRSRCRLSFETVCALTASSVRIATTRPTCRVEMPRKNASRISSITSAARR